MIYFIQADTDGPIKIGRSNAPADRLVALQTANHSPLRLLFSMDADDNSAALESALHWLFRRSRIGTSEWFLPAEDILIAIGELREFSQSLNRKFPYRGFSITRGDSYICIKQLHGDGVLDLEAY